MATDGVSLYYSPIFVDRLSMQECEGVLCHEVAHCALLHMTRRGSRDPVRWNIAADMAVNALLTADNIPLPAGCVPPGDLSKTAEDFYDELKANAKLSAGLRDLLDAVGEADNAAAAGVMPAEIERRWKQAVAQSAGLLPGGLRRQVETAQESVFPWREILAEYVLSYVRSAERTWVRVSRRLPGWTPGWQREPTTCVAIVVDTSGSIDDEVLRKFLAECQAILSGNGLSAYILAADEAVGLIVEPGQPFPAEWPGDGGTDFRPALKHCETLDEIAVVIYCTDGEGTYPVDCSKPVVWAMSTSYVPPFGQVVRLKE